MKLNWTTNRKKSKWVKAAVINHLQNIYKLLIPQSNGCRDKAVVMSFWVYLKKKKGGMISTFIHCHRCINVGVNWCIMTCVVKRYKLLIRWEKGHINTVHLASLSNNPFFARYMWSTINHMFCSQRAQMISEHSSCCLLCVFRQAWLNCLYLCSVS